MKAAAQDVVRKLEARDRKQGGMTVPAQGLTLIRIYYPQDEKVADFSGMLTSLIDNVSFP